jgi:uncharacterized protein (DUF305 family)
MTTRGRTAGFQMGAEHRTKIANSKILNRLIAHAEGEIDMTSTQVQAATTLLDRVMPKLATTTIEGGETPFEMIVRIGGDDPSNG